MANPVVLVFANKMDLPGALSASAVAEAMSLNSRRETWYIQPSSAVTGDGVTEGLEWLSQQVKLRPAKPRAGS
jgi:signal recognition particle receptor subunit beta